VNVTGEKNTIIGSLADVQSNALSNATAIGHRAAVGQSNSLVLGSINGVNGATADTKVGIGTTAPAARLTVSASSTNATDNTATFSAPNIGSNFSHIHFGSTGDWYIRSAANSGKVVLQDSGGNVGIGTTAPSDKLHVDGIIRFDTLPAGAGMASPLCRHNTSHQITDCSASSLRYKTNIAPFSAGLGVVNRLRPITFNWKASGEADFGLGAEEVAKVEPRLVTHNAKGEIEGVRYDRIAVVLLNAVKEQQHLIEQQQQQIEALKKLVCSSRRKAKACK
jgi:hypothetical protein